MGLKIDVIANDGSPLGVTMKSIWGDNTQIGVGGAELVLLTMCEAWHNAGNDVVLYNNPRESDASIFEQRAIDSFDPKESRDIVIIFRSPNLRVVGANGRKVWWSCDQRTVGNFRSFRTLVDDVVTISPYHQKYFESAYGIRDATVIDLPIRVQDYENKEIEKIKNRFIFSSIPDRGLDILLGWWPYIKKEIHDASLVITSDYRLWGVHLGMGNERYVQRVMALQDVTILSAVSRERLIEEQLKAEVHLYPCIYDELFCVSVAESQVAGIYTITSDCGSLNTTNMMTVINGDPRSKVMDFVLPAKQFSLDYDFERERVKSIQSEAIKRFHPDRILDEWNKKVFNHG